MSNRFPHQPLSRPLQDVLHDACQAVERVRLGLDEGATPGRRTAARISLILIEEALERAFLAMLEHQYRDR
ncbi:MAG TPA: hypothetical protein VNN09_05080 [Candidatus Competibacteraceae bacterium]|nr:hypothetical protein [Candidatus Competibacteraceae bacterium]